MKKAKQLFTVSLLGLTALAAPFLIPAGQAFGAVSFAEELRLDGQQQRNDQVASLGSEAGLSHALGIPASEVFSLDEPERLVGEFELKLPEEELPESDIPLTLNSKVEYFIDYFQTGAREAFAKWLSRSERYIPMMKKVLKKEGLPEDLVYLAMIESGFSPHAYSVASAVGPWQFMSGTGKRYALRIDHWIDERRDPLKSTTAAALYLKELYGIFNKDWYLAAAGYNAGENKILRAMEMYNSNDFWQLSKGTYLKRETKEYVPKMLAAAIIAKDPAKFGFADVAYLSPIELDAVKVPSQTDLDVIAKIIDTPYQTLRDLNPELRRGCTPPDYPDYELKIPVGKKEVFEAEFSKIPVPLRYTPQALFTSYRAGSRDTLASVARRFGTTPRVVAELNHLGKKSRVKGKLLVVPAKDSFQQEPAAAKGGVSKEFKKYYTVKKGDTLISLSKRFNVSTKFLSVWNNLTGKTALRAGKRIIIAKKYTEKQGTPTAVSEQKG